MVIVFPMLVSQSVSENAIPGIAKTLEGYLIVNHISDIMDNPEIKHSGFMKGFRSTRKGWFAKEGVNLLEDEDERNKLVGQGGTKSKRDFEKEIENLEKEKNALAREIQRQNDKIDALKFDKDEEKRKTRDAKEKLKIEKEKREGEEALKKEIDRLEKKRDNIERRQRDKKKEARADEEYKRKKIEDERKRKEEEEKRAEEKLKKAETKATARVTARDYKTMSLEPSYIEVDITLKSGGTEKKFIGIKVLPYRVNSSVKLSRLILHDTQLKSLDAAMISLGRKMMRYFYGLLDKWSSRLKFGGTTVSGDPRRDILMGRTGKNTLGIIVLDKNEDIDERFLKNISRLNRLFSLGWGNIVVSDDINRQAYFCMRGYNGTCQILHYATMYQNLGQLKVYDSIEDATRQNSSLFKVSAKASKIFSEWKTHNKLLKYISEDR